ncbi:MAG: DUF115 domain-containing protein [Treponema sp.]|jgi:hypothetical protein|nr:DUF115 domain-containing protein [Treponema sp.]
MEGGFSYRGKTLLSRVDPAGKADRVADTVPVIDGTLYLCPSPLYGYGRERLLARLEEHAPNSAVLCIEAEPELFALSHGHFSEALKRSPQLRLTNRCEAAGLCSLIRKEWGARVFRRIQILRLNGGWQLYPDLDNLANTLQREIALDWGNAMTLARLGRRYMQNAIRNLALIPGSFSIDALSFGAEPVLTLGAGPSLDPFLDALVIRFGQACLLPETRPFRIVCVDTCLPALRERGIRPDLAIILESQHWNLDDFTGLSGWDIPAAFDLSALPGSARALGNRLFLFFTPWTRLCIFRRLGAAGLLPASLPPLGSVGITAAAISIRLTRGAVITAGLDFSFTLDSFHARSTPGHLARLRRQNRFTGLINAEAAFGHSVLGTVSKTGKKVLSNPAMRNYRELFEKQFTGCPRLFDMAGSGLPLGIKTLSTDEAFFLLTNTGQEVNRRCEDEKITLTSANTALLTGITQEVNKQSAEKLRNCILDEVKRLTLLRGILTGEAPMDYGNLAGLIEECDYLWAHFPDYAASSRRPDRAELESGGQAVVSFLKRLRAEIDPFLTLWKQTLLF